jgi:hypothetical protein
MDKLLTNKLIKVYLLIYFFLIVTPTLVIYVFEPFGNNKCVKGDCKNGYGIYIYNSGMKYIGEWKNEKRHGKGTLIYPDGTKYIGEWKDNKMHGYGIKTYNDVRLYKYIGEWKNGLKNGKGTQIYTTGEKYVGEWKNNKFHGYGTYTSVNGMIHRGEWRNGRMHGYGVRIYPDGTKIMGKWVNNRLVGSSDFYLADFEGTYNIEKLCSAIKADIRLSLKAQENTVEWLNELLKVPDLYEKLHRKIQRTRLPEEIKTLLEETRDFRYKKFSELNSDKQKAIKKLNRLLLEHLYPKITPKIKTN